jgi:hypothetical protein
MAAILCAIAAGGELAASQQKTGDIVTTPQPQVRFRYLSTEVDEIHPLRLEAVTGGGATLWVGSNADAPETRAVGRYAGTAPARELGALQAAVASPAFRAIAEPDGLAPGTPVRTLSMSVDGAEEVSRSTASSEPPEAFRVAETAARALVAHLLATPVTAVSVRLVSAGVQARTPRVLDLALELVNAGSRTLTLTPFGGAPPDTRVTVNALRDGVPPEKFTLGDQMLVDAAASHLRAAEPPLAAGKPLAIPPRGKQRLRLAVPMDPRPGTWSVRVQVEAGLGDDAGHQLERCELHSNAVPFRP